MSTFSLQYLTGLLTVLYSEQKSFSLIPYKVIAARSWVDNFVFVDNSFNIHSTPKLSIYKSKQMSLQVMEKLFVAAICQRIARNVK